MLSIPRSRPYQCRTAELNGVARLKVDKLKEVRVKLPCVFLGCSSQRRYPATELHRLCKQVVASPLVTSSTRLTAAATATPPRRAVLVEDSEAVSERRTDGPRRPETLPPSLRIRRLGCLLYTSPSPRDGLLSRM